VQQKNLSICVKLGRVDDDLMGACEKGSLVVFTNQDSKTTKKRETTPEHLRNQRKANGGVNNHHYNLVGIFAFID
jgi:hypothetical protein